MSETTAEYKTNRTPSFPKHLARTGIFYLEEAVLDVLFEAIVTQEDAFVRAVDIRRKVGVYEDWDEDGWLVAGILRKLDVEGRAQQKEDRGPWKITEAEYQKRR